MNEHAPNDERHESPSPQAESTEKPTGKVNPNAMTPAELAQLLSAAGPYKITEEMVQQDIKDGAPTNPDGTVNFIHYTAWLAREDLRGSQPSSPASD